jgi:hypothetical protein
VSETTGSGSSGSKRSGIRLNRARSGPITAALDESLAELRDRGALVGEARVFAALARRTALVIDAAWRVDDSAAVLRSTRELRELVDLLPLRSTKPKTGEEAGKGDGGRGRVLELLDSPPSVGNEA